MSWLAALAAVPAALLTAAAGQGVGTVLGRGEWIGVCLPWDRGVWALVNQPTISFAASWTATGYWLGAWAVPLGVALVVVFLSLRVATLSGQLVVLQFAWICLVIGAGWQVFLDPVGGQLGRWLVFHGLPPELRWIAIAATATGAVPIVLRLLAIARISRYHLGRARRIGHVLWHLAPIPFAWSAMSCWLRGEFPIEAGIAAVAPFLAGLVVAWIGYPAPPTHSIAPAGLRASLTLGLVTAVGCGMLWAAGRPLPDDRAAAVQWARDSATNNIRPWMAPWRAPWLER